MLRAESWSRVNGGGGGGPHLVLIALVGVLMQGTSGAARVSASLAGEQYGLSEAVAATVGSDVAPREAQTPTADDRQRSAVLVERFRNERVSHRQFAIAKEIVDRHDVSVLPSLAPWLAHDDRHIRGNTAFIFAALGDPRGFQTIVDMLTDASDRPPGQGIPMASSDGRYHVELQVRADRYYAAHLLGDLRDPRALPILVALLKDKEVNSIVPWALGQIGDKRAVGPLLDALDEDNPSMRVLSIYALETLNAKEAISRLVPLLDDHRKSNFGDQISVAEAAKAAIAKLQ